MAQMVDEFTDEEGVRLKALEKIAGRVVHAQGAVAADALTEFRLVRAPTSMPPSVRSGSRRLGRDVVVLLARVQRSARWVVRVL